MKPETRFLFVLCPSFCGSTLLYKILGSSSQVTTLINNGNWQGEGIWLVMYHTRYGFASRPRGNPNLEQQLADGKWWDPEFFARRWDPTFPLNMAHVGRCYRHYWDSTKTICVDKSPQNLCRAKRFEHYFSQFGKVSFIVMTRSPYSYRGAAETWVRDAKWQLKNLKQLGHVMHLKYEDLVLKPQESRKRIMRFMPELGNLDMLISGVQGLNSARNHRLKQRYAKRVIDREAKNKVLRHHRTLMRKLGYWYTK